MTAPITHQGPGGQPLRDQAVSGQGVQHLDAMEHNIRQLRQALGLAGQAAPEDQTEASTHALVDPASHKVSGPAFAVFHGTAMLFIGLTALYFGGRWALEPTAQGRALGAVIALLGLIGLFYGTRRLLRLMHSPPIVSDSDTPNP
jgi:hypothetical protein